jgi:site-specific DNA-cytosine methylase
MKLRPLRPTRRGKVDVDLFAGGGGWSEGKRRATGRSPDVAVNHWPTAIDMHGANHPSTASTSARTSARSSRSRRRRAGSCGS